jgi:hypothetical protein
MKLNIFYCITSILLTIFFQGDLAFAAGDGTGLKTSIAVDLVGDANATSDSGASDKLGPREAEVALYAPIDHIFDGQMSFAAHNEGGASLFEIHEAFIGSDRLIPGSRFRIGQYFLGIGRLNRIHRHDWPFISAPIVHEKFFGAEGALDSGLEYSLLAPLPFYLDITVGVSNGFTYGHTHTAGDKPIKPTHYARVATFASIGDLDMQPAVNFLDRQAANGEDMRLIGIDFTAKVKSRDVQKVLVQAEVWQRSLKPKNAESETAIGYYVYPQYGFESHILFGVRYDNISVTSLKDASGSAVVNSESGFVPTLTYKPSEFSTFRLAYDIFENKQESETKKIQKIEVQGTYILGAHPAHDF